MMLGMLVSHTGMPGFNSWLQILILACCQNGLWDAALTVQVTGSLATQMRPRLSFHLPFWPDSFAVIGE